MTNLREAAQMALEALRQYTDVVTSENESNAWVKVVDGGKPARDAIEALREALAQPEQEIEPDRPHVEDDGCPTEKAVLQRFWREHQAQPEQEPVAWKMKGVPAFATSRPNDTDSIKWDALYTAPPQRDEAPAKAVEWQGLTDEEIEDACWTEVDQRLRSFARAIEAKLKEKNNG